MEILVLLFINFVAFAASEKYTFLASVGNVMKHPNQWLLVKNSHENIIKEVVVTKEITDEDGLTVEYTIKDKSGNVLGNGSGALCSDPDSDVGMIASLLGQFLNVNLDCPVSEQRGTRPSGSNSGPIELAEDPGQQKLFADISLKKSDSAIVTISINGGIQK